MSNINRQLIATHQTIGRDKVAVMRERILSINPAAIVETHKAFVLPENAGQFIDDSLDYIVDAVDTVSAKIALGGDRPATPGPDYLLHGSGQTSSMRLTSRFPISI